MGVHDIEPRVQPSLADRHVPGLRQLSQRLVVEARIDGRFRHTIAVNDSELRAVTLLQQPVIRHTAAVGARDEQLHGAHIQTLLRCMLHERYDQRRSRFEDIDPAVANPAVQPGRINSVVFGTYHHRPAVIQRSCDITDEYVERKARQLKQPYRELIQPVFTPVSLCRIHQAAMLDHNAFGTSRRPRCIDHISKIMRLTPYHLACVCRAFIRSARSRLTVRLLVIETKHALQRQPIFQPFFGALLQMVLRQKYRC